MSPQNSPSLVSRIAKSRAVIAILLSALILRVWGINFGLPFLFHNDEGFEVIRALQLGSGQFDFDRIGKGGLFYVLFIEYGILFVALKLLGIVESAQGFAQLFVDDPSAFYLLGRLTTALMGTATVYFCYRIGKVAYSVRAGILAAILMAGNVLHAELSHYITVDVPVTFLATVSLFFAIRLAEQGNRNDYFLAALFAALAATTKLPAVLLLPALLGAHFLYTSRAQIPLTVSLRHGTLWQSAAIFIGTYLVLTPGIVVNFDSFFLAYLRRFAPADGASAPGASATGANLPENPDMFAFYAEKLADSATLPVFALCLAGLIYAMYRRNGADVVLLLFAVPMYLVLSLSDDPRLFYPRYALPIIPVMAVLGGRLLDRLFGWQPAFRHLAGIIAAVILLMAAPIYQIVKNDYLLSQPDTREIGRAWIHNNIPQGAKIMIEGATARTRNGTIPLDNSDENIRAAIAQFGKSEPGKARYFRMALNSPREKTYDLLFYDADPGQLLPLAEYKAQGVEYLVLRRDDRNIVRRDLARKGFNEQVRDDPDFVLVKSIAPDPLRHPGPDLEIYRVERRTEP